MMQITFKELGELVSNLQDMSNMEEIQFRSDYSGRGMYGKTCLGFVVENPLLVHGAICAILAEAERDADHAGIDHEGLTWYDLRPSMDSMGLSSILYYTNVEVVD